MSFAVCERGTTAAEPPRHRRLTLAEFSRLFVLEADHQPTAQAGTFFWEAEDNLATHVAAALGKVRPTLGRDTPGPSAGGGLEQHPAEL
jgi:hypothetical protein